MCFSFPQKAERLFGDNYHECLALGPPFPIRSPTLLVKNKLSPSLSWMAILLAILKSICGKWISPLTYYSCTLVGNSFYSWTDSQKLLSAWTLTLHGPVQLSFCCPHSAFSSLCWKIWRGRANQHLTSHLTSNQKPLISEDVLRMNWSIAKIWVSLLYLTFLLDFSAPYCHAFIIYQCATDHPQI